MSKWFSLCLDITTSTLNLYPYWRITDWVYSATLLRLDLNSRGNQLEIAEESYKPIDRCVPSIRLEATHKSFGEVWLA